MQTLIRWAYIKYVLQPALDQQQDNYEVNEAMHEKMYAEIRTDH